MKINFNKNNRPKYRVVEDTDGFIKKYRIEELMFFGLFYWRTDEYYSNDKNARLRIKELTKYHEKTI